MRSLTFALRVQIFLYLLGAVLAAAVVGLLVWGGSHSSLAAAVVAGSVALLAAALALLERALVQPLSRLVEALEAMGRLDPEGPLLAESPSLSALAIGVDRLAKRLGAERERTQAGIRALQAMNAELTRARDELVRTEKLATVGTLAAGVAHEVGNPLGAILGYVELARRRPAQMADLVEKIEGEARRIDHIVRELLDFSRPRELSIGPVYLWRVAENALSLVKMQKRFDGILVANQIPADLPAVRADERRLVQVLVNLLLNAADAVQGQGQGQGQGRVALRAWADADRVVLTVSDSGPGIAPEVAGRIFEPFVTTKPPGSGTGLGLAICARIMEECRGEIAAGRAPEGGAELRLTLRAWSA